MRTAKKMSQRSEDEIWNYQQIELGFNYRMNDVQAALGYSQLKKLNKFLKKRRKIAIFYKKKIEKFTRKFSTRK